MTRRTFLAALSCLPIVGKYVPQPRTIATTGCVNGRHIGVRQIQGKHTGCYFEIQRRREAPQFREAVGPLDCPRCTFKMMPPPLAANDFGGNPHYFSA